VLHGNGLLKYHLDKDNRLMIGIYLDKKIDKNYLVFFILDINYPVTEVFPKR